MSDLIQFEADLIKLWNDFRAEPEAFFVNVPGMNTVCVTSKRTMILQADDTWRDVTEEEFDKVEKFILESKR